MDRWTLSFLVYLIFVGGSVASLGNNRDVGGTQPGGSGRGEKCCLGVSNSSGSPRSGRESQLVSFGENNKIVALNREAKKHLLAQGSEECRLPVILSRN